MDEINSYNDVMSLTMSEQSIELVAIILPALIGALSSCFGDNLVSEWLKREEKHRVRKDLTNKYLILLQLVN
jgi:hypothetical protein